MAEFSTQCQPLIYISSGKGKPGRKKARDARDRACVSSQKRAERMKKDEYLSGSHS